jgi:hypothetical protein
LPHFNIHIFINDNWAFPAQFEADGREVLGSGSGNNASNLPVAGVPVVNQLFTLRKTIYNRQL